ncbi:MAG: transport system ATP-binding/permease protein, partial [Alphaproteobacteria bacterium]|nr:transport system ATP-binding/permease protein [Alphaproteobacteria bacterium]
MANNGTRATGPRCIALVGPFQSGKTTLLEALAGVRPAERGRVRFDGVDLYENFDSFRRLLGYVPQDDIIHADLPLERTLRYAAALRLPESRSSADVDAAVDRALTALDLSQRADVRVGALSGGQRKRASIAVELLTSPPVFFLDEPTSGLDPLMEAVFRECIVEERDNGRTVLLSSHILAEVEALCDRVSIIRAGRTVDTGTLSQLRHLTRTSIRAELANPPTG